MVVAACADLSFFLIGSSCESLSALRLEGVIDAGCCFSCSLGLVVDADGWDFFVAGAVDDLLKKLEMDPLSWSTGITKSDELLVVGPTASVTW